MLACFRRHVNYMNVHHATEYLLHAHSQLRTSHTHLKLCTPNNSPKQKIHQRHLGKRIFAVTPQLMTSHTHLQRKNHTRSLPKTSWIDFKWCAFNRKITFTVRLDVGAHIHRSRNIRGAILYKTKNVNSSWL